MSATHKRCPGTSQLPARRRLQQAIVSLLAGCLLLAGGGPARAEPPPPPPMDGPAQVVLWSVQRGCYEDFAAEKTLISRLESFAGRPVIRLNPPADSQNLNCVGEQCALLLQKSCSQLTGQLIGAEIDEMTTFDGRTPELVVRLRVWRHDLVSHENYYLYGLCPRGVCGDLSVADKLAEMASHLVERQPFEQDMRSIGEVLMSRLPLCAMQSPAALARQLIASQTDLCRPFPAPRCPVNDSAPAGAPLRSSSGPAELSRGLIRGTQGAFWVLFAASAATAVTLFAFNASDVGTLIREDDTLKGTLLRPAVTAAGFGVMALAVAIPTTIFLGRAARSSTRPDPPMRGELRCPQQR